MPRNRPRTTTRGSWTVQTLEVAIKIIQGGMSVRQVSLQSGIPYSTLKKRFSAAKNNDVSHNRPPKAGRKPIFSEDEEESLVTHLLHMSRIFFGLTAIQFRKTVYHFAVTLGVPHRFDSTKKIAGKDWLCNFLIRHPELSIRKPEATSLNRIEGFNKAEVDRFFANLEQEMTKHKFGPQQIFNVDESGFSTVQEPGKILAPKGEKRVGAVTSWERGKNVTVIGAMSASGSFVPPLFIFPRKRHSLLLEKDDPPGAAYECTHNGWTNEKTFMKWLHHFATYVKPSEDNRILLILDNHNSHGTKDSYDFCKRNYISMVTIPPHTSHRLQPLDVTFFGPLKNAYNRECDLYIKTRNLTKITPYEIAGLFNKAYAKVASLEKGISGFRSTGIFPMNPGIFNEEDFIIYKQATTSPAILDPQSSTTPFVRPDRSLSPQPSTSRAGDVHDNDPKLLNNRILQMISPRPLIKPSLTNKRNKQHSEILTGSPMKMVLEEKLKKRQMKENKKQQGKENAKKQKRMKAPQKQRDEKIRKITKNLFHSDSSSDTSIDESKLCDDNSDDDDGEIEENMCIICNDVGKNDELWYRCRLGGHWAHAECCDCEDPENFYCDFCLSK